MVIKVISCYWEKRYFVLNNFFKSSFESELKHNSKLLYYNS